MSDRTPMPVGIDYDARVDDTTINLAHARQAYAQHIEDLGIDKYHARQITTSLTRHLKSIERANLQNTPSLLQYREGVLDGCLEILDILGTTRLSDEFKLLETATHRLEVAIHDRRIANQQSDDKGEMTDE